MAADEAERAFHYTGDGDVTDDPAFAALDGEVSRCHQEMVQTVPTTAEGLALMLVALTFDQVNFRAGARFNDPASWGAMPGSGRTGATTG